MRLVSILLLGALAPLSACAPGAPGTPAPDPAPAPTAVISGDQETVDQRAREVHWFRSAAEYRANALQTYRAASERLRELEAPLEDGTWGVILDADETVLDNSELEKRIAERGEAFTEEAWDAWVLEEAAPAIPGAADFIALVHALGGQVAIVTNRHAGICAATENNLDALGIAADVVLCETDTSEKEGRFRMVQEGTASPDLGPIEVLMWIGDNIGDFPDLDQGLRDAPAASYALFGDRYFVLPNPMYGSWMGNAWH